MLQAQGKQDLLDTLRGILPTLGLLRVYPPVSAAGPWVMRCCARDRWWAMHRSWFTSLMTLIEASVPCLKQMVDVFEQYHGGSVLGVQNVPPQDTDKYGIVTLEKFGRTPAWQNVSGSLRNRNLRRLPRRLAVVGRYLLLSASIFDDLATHR